MLISSCEVIERMATGRGGKLKAPVVKRESFELKRKGRRIFSKPIGKEDYASLRWRGKSSSGSEFRLENGLTVQIFRNSSVQP